MLDNDSKLNKMILKFGSMINRDGKIACKGKVFEAVYTQFSS